MSKIHIISIQFLSWWIWVSNWNFSYQKNQVCDLFAEKHLLLACFINYTVWNWQIFGVAQQFFFISTRSLTLSLSLVLKPSAKVLISFHLSNDRFCEHVNLRLRWLKTLLKLLVEFNSREKRRFSVNRRISFRFKKKIGFSWISSPYAIYQVLKQRNGFKLHCCSIKKRKCAGETNQLN